MSTPELIKFTICAILVYAFWFVLPQYLTYRKDKKNNPNTTFDFNFTIKFFIACVILLAYTALSAFIIKITPQAFRLFVLVCLMALAFFIGRLFYDNQ